MDAVTRSFVATNLLRSHGGGGGAFSPLDLAALTGWWDFSDAPTVYEDTIATNPAEADDGVAYLGDKSGDGRHLTQGTAGSRPAWKAAIQNGLSIGRGDGGDILTRASVTGSALFGTNVGTVVLVLKHGPGTDNFAFAWMNDASNAVNIFCTYSDTIYFDFGQYDAGGRITVAQPVGWDNNWHVVVCHRKLGAGRIIVDGVILREAEFTDTLNNAIAGTLQLMGYGGGPNFTGDMGEAFAFNDGLLVTEINDLCNYLATKWAATWPDLRGPWTVVCEGDSLTLGTGAVAASSYPAQLATLLGTSYGVINLGVGSETIDDMATHAQLTDGMGWSAAGKNICVAWAGTNDIYGAESGADAYADYVAYCAARQAAGFLVVAVTMLPRSGGSPPGDLETQRGTFNTSIRNNWATFANALADVAGSSLIGDAGDELNATYYADATHLNATGYGVVAGIVQTAIGTL